MSADAPSVAVWILNRNQILDRRRFVVVEINKNYLSPLVLSTFNRVNMFIYILVYSTHFSRF